MKDYQKAVEKMIDEVLLFFKENDGKLKADKSILQKHVDVLAELDKELATNKTLQEADITGIAVEKKKAKAELSENIYQITGALRSFATDNNNDLLYEEIDESKSGINKKADEDVVSYCNLVIDKLTEYQKALEPYGIKAEDLVNLTKENRAFEDLLLMPAKMRKGVKVATANIKTIISKSLKVLSESIDNDMLQYQDSKPDLYKEYVVLREIDDNQITPLSIIGTVNDTDDDCDGREDCSLQHVRATVKFRAGKAWKEMHTVTSAKGNYQFKGIPDGKCTVTFELEYYDTLIKEIAVYSDKATKLDVEIKKIIG